MLEAIKACWNHTSIQRCQFHISLNFKQKFGRKLATPQAKQLRQITRLICHIDTPFRLKLWWLLFSDFSNKLDLFIKHSNLFYKTKETIEINKVKLFRKKLYNLWKSGELFACVIEDRFKVYNTTNKVEGGVNTGISELIADHRGATEEMQCFIVEVFLMVL